MYMCIARIKDHNINNVLITMINKRGQGHSEKIRKVPHIPDNQPVDFISNCTLITICSSFK